MRNSSVEVHNFEQDDCAKDPVEVNSNVGIPTSTVLTSMSKFKSSHKKSLHNNTTDHLTPKEVHVGLIPKLN